MNDRPIGPSPPQLVIFCGLQASGKTTFFDQRFSGTHEHVSKDRMRNNRRKEARQRELVSEALAAGRSVVVDNTNPTRQDRRPLVELGRWCGARVVGYWFRADVSGAILRNARRSGVENIPVVGILATAKRFEAPTSDEGYDALFTVSLAHDGFTVE